MEEASLQAMHVKPLPIGNRREALMAFLLRVMG
jgi:hypothetical protein